MAALDLQVVGGGRQHEVFQADGDPQDVVWLRQQLRSWLKGNNWPGGTWDRFSLRVRKRGQSKVVNTVRAV